MNILCYMVMEISLTVNEERKKNNNNKNKQEKAGSKSRDATSHCQFTYKTLTFYLNSS